MRLNYVPTVIETDISSDVTVISSRQFQQIQQGSQTLLLSTEDLPRLRTYIRRKAATSGAGDCWCVSSGEIILASMFGSKGHMSKSLW